MVEAMRVEPDRRFAVTDVVSRLRDAGTVRIAQRLIGAGYMIAWIVAAVISWRTIRDAADVYLDLPWKLDWVYPLVLDGPMLTWSGVIWLTRRQGQSAGVATWAWLVVFGVFSAAANIAAHVEPNPDWHHAITIAMAALPPVAAIVALERGARQLSEVPEHVPSNVPSGVPVGSHVPSDVPSGVPVGSHVPSDVPSGVPVGSHVRSDVPVEHVPDVRSGVPSGVRSDVPVIGSHVPSDVPSGVPVGSHVPSNVPSDVPVVGSHVRSDVPVEHVPVVGSNVPSEVPVIGSGRTVRDRLVKLFASNPEAMGWRHVDLAAAVGCSRSAVTRVLPVPDV